MNDLAGRTPGPQARLPRVARPDAKHKGSRVKAAGTREAKSGRRRDYRCYPIGGTPHKFAVIIDVPDRTVPAYATPPDSPSHGANAAIKRDGTYGPKGESVRRQTYCCRPNDLAERAKYARGVHYFTPPLAREHVHFGADHCGECEEFLGVHRGEQVVARRQSWNLRVGRPEFTVAPGWGSWCVRGRGPFEGSWPSICRTPASARPRGARRRWRHL